ncbi:MAG: hypothetical protein AAGL23_15955 [Pseudomonadota bacterium]
MSQVELKVAYKALKVEFVGSEEFLKDGFVKMCQDIAALQIEESPGVSGESSDLGASSVPVGLKSKKSTTDFAVALSASSGPDLAIAAGAYLHFTEGKEELKRAELLDAMKSAKSFYKSTYSGNLSSILNGLVKKGRLTNPGNEVYALSYSETETLKSHAG